jgi:hypothetical protein
MIIGGTLETLRTFEVSGYVLLIKECSRYFNLPSGNLQ